jgi:hypothetical protein
MLRPNGLALCKAGEVGRGNAIMKTVTTFRGKTVCFFSAQVMKIRFEDIGLPKPHFVSTFFLHDTDWNEDDLTELLHRLIKNGCVYLLFHGRGCKKAHDLADAAQSQDGTPENVIMTTWHERESVKDVIFDTFITAHPAEDYADSFTSYVVFSFGSNEENGNVKYFLDNLETTIKQASEEL